MYLQASGFVNVLDVPDRPKNLKPDEVRAEHIKMSWQRPDDDGGSPITGYVLRMMDLEAGNWITIDEVSFERTCRRPITIYEKSYEKYYHYHHVHSVVLKIQHTGLGKRVVPRLRELAPRGERESGGGIHAT